MTYFIFPKPLEILDSFVVEMVSLVFSLFRSHAAQEMGKISMGCNDTFDTFTDGRYFESKQRVQGT